MYLFVCLQTVRSGFQGWSTNLKEADWLSNEPKDDDSDVNPSAEKLAAIAKTAADWAVKVRSRSETAAKKAEEAAAKAEAAEEALVKAKAEY